MASIIVPLAMAVEPAVVELVVKLVDKIFGSKTGPVKRTVSTAIVQTLGAGLVQAGQMAAEHAPDAAVASAQVQRMVDTLNPKGELRGVDTLLAPADTVDKGDLRSLLRILEPIAIGLGVAPK